MIREELNARFGPVCAHQTRILYGGSVTPKNCGSILKMPNIDGALIGGASLEPNSLAEIVNYAL